jgi:hypothetical protein
MYQKPLPVKLDYDNLKVHFGKAEISVFTRLKGVKGNYHLINEVLYGANMVCTDPKKVYADFTEEVGITPKAAIKVINNVGWKIIAGDFTSAQIFKWCYPRGVKRQINQHSVTTLHNMKDVVKQMLLDGQENLIPIVLRSAMTPKQIKDSLQKHEWKQLTKISFTKAQYLSNAVTINKLYDLGKYLDLNLSYLANCSHQLLDKDYPHLVINRLSKQGRCLTNRDKIYDISRIVADTTMIAEEIGYTVNPNWSLKRWHEEHTIVTRKRRSREFSEAPIQKGVYLHLPREITSEKGDKATLLESPLSVALEGDSMGHCVAGYVSRCVKGEYAVYHTELSDGTIGTLGCNVYDLPVPVGSSSQQQLRYQQCYGKYNARIDTEFARYVVEQANKTLLEKE